jgi:rod shape-determining protein MreC
MASPPLSRRPLFLAILLAGGFEVALTLQVRRGERSLLGQAALTFFGPVLSAFDGASRFVREGWDAWIYQHEAVQRAERLDAENRELKARLLLGRHLEEENRSLRELLRAASPARLEPSAVRVFTRFGAPFGRYYLVSSPLALPDDTPLLTERGLVGRVKGRVGTLYRVVAATDPSSAAGVASERTGVKGVAVGAGDHILVRYVSNEADVQTGDVFATSGEDGLFPPGLRVGTVEEVADGGDYLKKIRLRPAVDPQALRWALALRPHA